MRILKLRPTGYAPEVVEAAVSGPRGAEVIHHEGARRRVYDFDERTPHYPELRDHCVRHGITVRDIRYYFRG